MKQITLFSTLCFLILTIGLKAQNPPNAFNYSAVARNSSGQPISNATIGIQINILKNSPTGTSQYSENHVVNTDAFGLFNLVIGAGAIQSGSMTTINWSNDNYYIKIGMDANGGTNFLTIGTTQLLSVPYALHAKSAETSSALTIDTLTTGVTINFDQSLDLDVSVTITSPSLLNDVLYISTKTYLNGVLVCPYGSGCRITNNVSGDIIDVKVFIRTFTGIKYYTQTYINP